MNKSGLLGEALEKGQSTVKQIGKGAMKTTGSAVKAAGAQITGTDIGAQDIVNSLYGVSDAKKTNIQSIQNQQASQAGDAGKNPTEELDKEKKLKELRAKLHQEVYYDPLTNPKKPEERPAEKVEKEKEQEVAELAERKKEKPPPLAIQRTQQRVEKFPGRSG